MSMTWCLVLFWIGLALDFRWWGALWVVLLVAAVCQLCGCSVDVDGSMKHTFEIIPNGPCTKCLPRCDSSGDYYCAKVSGERCSDSCSVTCLGASHVACLESGRVSCRNTIGGDIEVPTVCEEAVP